MKIWIDDIRLPPTDGWTWVKTSQEAMDLIQGLNLAEVEEVSFDHDLGYLLDENGNPQLDEYTAKPVDDTSRRIAYYMCEVEQFPERVYVHSSNSVGRDYLIGMFERYGNGAEYREYIPPVNFIVLK